MSEEGLDHFFALPRGHRLAEYTIRSVLGNGGFGITYLVHDAHLSQQFAIKEYIPSSLAVRDHTATVRPIAKERRQDFLWGKDSFLREARTMARFHHPHLVRVHRFFEAHGTAYIVMDFVEGRRFDDVLSDYPQGYPSFKLIELLKILLNSVGILHDEGILHRDIKPGNIMLRSDGAPILLDFGAAREFSAHLSHSVTALASSGYAPLEQYSTSGSQGPWTDIYGLASVAYRAISGAPPPEALVRLRDDPLVAAVERGAGRYGGNFLKAIDWGLQIYPEHRPQSIMLWRPALLGTAAVPAANGAARPRFSFRSFAKTNAVAAVASPGRGSAAAPVQAGHPSRWRSLKAGALLAILACLAAAGWLGLRRGDDYQQTNDIAPVDRSATPPTAVAMPAIDAPLPTSAAAVAPSAAEIVVDPAGAGNAVRIDEGIAKAAAGSIIHLRPGDYTVGVVLDKDVHLIGSREEPSRVRVTVAGGSCLASSAADASVAGLSLRNEGSRAPCIQVSAGRLRLENVDVNSPSGVGLSVSGEGEVAARAMHIRGAGEQGLVVRDGGRLILEHSTIEGSGGAGAQLQKAGEVQVRGSRLVAGKNVGVLIADGSAVRLIENVIADNAWSGIEILRTQGTFIGDNEISGNREAGLFLSRNSSATVLGNRVVGNGLSGIVVLAAAGRFERNRIETNADHGIYLAQGSRGTLIGNKISDNHGHGVAVDRDGRVELRGNIVENNKEPQVIRPGGEERIGEERL